MTALASLSRRISRSLIPLSRPQVSYNFSTDITLNHEQSDNECDDEASKPDTEANSDPNIQPLNFERPLENGLDQGVYKAILVGLAGQVPVQKKLKSGRFVTLFSVGTGGIRNNRRPLDDEDPKEYANRCNIQWHRVSVYPEKLGRLAEKNVKSGSIIYIEGNLESKVFSDPVTGLVRRIREVAVRRNGRLVFLGKEGGVEALYEQELRNTGYY